MIRADSRSPSPKILRRLSKINPRKNIDDRMSYIPSYHSTSNARIVAVCCLGEMLIVDNIKIIKAI